jgi:hypothetical protein
LSQIQQWGVIPDGLQEKVIAHKAKAADNKHPPLFLMGVTT